MTLLERPVPILQIESFRHTGSENTHGYPMSWQAKLPNIWDFIVFTGCSNDQMASIM